MAFLRFEAESCGVELLHADSVDEYSGEPKRVLSLSLTREKLRELHAALGEIREKEGSELRSELPKGWTVFWKIRSGESRFFVARPEVDQWVATLALSSAHFEWIRSQMADGVGGALSRFEPISRMSNFEVVLAVRSEGSA